MSDCPVKQLERLKRFAEQTRAAAEFSASVAQAAKQVVLLTQWFVQAAGDGKLTWDSKVEVDLRVRYEAEAGKPTELTLGNVALPLAIVLKAVHPIMEFMAELMSKLESDVQEMNGVLGNIDPRNLFFAHKPSEDGSLN